MSLIREATAGMQYLVRTSRFCMWAVSPVIAPQGMPAGREALAPVAGDLKDRLQAVADHLGWASNARMPQIVQPSR